jgi:hypothetical protein
LSSYLAVLCIDDGVVVDTVIGAMAAPALSASYVRPAPTIACALQNVLRGSRKSLQGVSVMEVGIASRGVTGNVPSDSQGSTSGSFEGMSRRGFRMEQQCRGWSSSRGMRVQASAAAVETAESPKVSIDHSHEFISCNWLDLMVMAEVLQQT